MNIFTIDENKVLTLATESKWYVGEGDFEHIQVIMSPEVSGNDMSEWLSSIRLCVVRDAMKWYRTLTFTLDDDGNYISDTIDVDGAWCLKEGEVLFFVQFEKDSDLGVTNQVCVEIYPSEDTDVLYDGFATEVWVQEQLESKQDTLVSGTNIKTINSQSILGSGDIVIEGSDINIDTSSLTDSDEYVPSSKLTQALLDEKQDTLVYGGQITYFNGGTATPINYLTVELTDEAKTILGTTDDTYNLYPSTNASNFNAYECKGMYFIYAVNAEIHFNSLTLNVGDFLGVNGEHRSNVEWTISGHLDIVTRVNGLQGNVELDIPIIATSASTEEDTVYDVSYVNNALDSKADDDSVVHLSGDESISGKKTFSERPYVLNSGLARLVDIPTSDISANTTARHTHDNKSVLDGISSAKVTSWDSKQDALTIATSESTTEGQVYDVTYINSIIGDIESLLSEV